MSSQPPDQALIEQGSKKISNEDVEKVVNKAEDIRKKFNPGGPLGRFIEDAKLLIALIQDYWSGAYRRIPYGTIAAIAFTLLYIFNPLDLIPDVLPVIGQIDDATVFAACLLLAEQDLLAYKEWKLSQET